MQSFVEGGHNVILCKGHHNEILCRRIGGWEKHGTCPTGNPSPAPTHPHRTHDTTDQWREIRLVASPILEKGIAFRVWPRPTSNCPWHVLGVVFVTRLMKY